MPQLYLRGLWFKTAPRYHQLTEITFKYLSVATCVVVASFAALALARVYDCEVVNAGPNESWAIPPPIVVVEEEGDVAVIDGLIQEVNGKPIAGKIAVDNAKRTTFSWTLDKVRVGVTESNSERNAKFVYRLTYFKKAARRSPP
ncbi:hypothetical protein K3556_06530 [Aliiroseovarius sp. M344]|uniref:hypothetical protein n=1 Tax=Aliiroseovarius sp. M344 TaxID=2867010 RepID=UPI0021ADD950|nr:hypothetical protein [Aliiroseovarius sp. M344]UWQ15529.1 hypothetical protein K3556_06530 [Aliiroseovarius sp. M344]